MKVARERALINLYSLGGAPSILPIYERRRKRESTYLPRNGEIGRLPITRRRLRMFGLRETGWKSKRVRQREKSLCGFPVIQEFLRGARKVAVVPSY